MTNYDKQRAQQIASAAIAAGFRAFLAEKGNYGFYTDAKGTKIVSFQCNGISDCVSGNYKSNQPQKTGTGWRIDDSVNIDALYDYFSATPPRWATSDARWDYTTLEDHLSTYQSSSKYKEQT